MSITVTIEECYGARAKHVSTHHTTDEGEAIRRAIVRAYGPGRFLVRDHGISTRDTAYGQIGHHIGRSTTISTDTGRVCITTDA